MSKESRDEISRIMGVEPVMINAALVSAQNRKRLFWANFPITQPEDKGIMLKDILESGDTDRLKSYAIDANYYKGGKIGGAHQSSTRNYTIRIGHIGKGRAKTGLYAVKQIVRKLTPIECARLQCFPDNWCEELSNTRQYKAYGNAVNVEVVRHIIKNLLNSL